MIHITKYERNTYGGTFLDYVSGQKIKVEIIPDEQTT